MVLTRETLEGDLAVSKGEGGEGGEGQSAVGSGARVGVDELGSDRVDGAEGDGGVVRARPGLVLVDLGRDPALVTSLGGEDGTSDGQVGLVDDGGGGTEVGCGSGATMQDERRVMTVVCCARLTRNSDVLDDGGKGGKALGVGVGEGVLAGLDGGLTQSSGEELDVGSLVLGDLGESTSDPSGVSGSLEGGGVELGEGVSVKGVLEVLQGDYRARHERRLDRFVAGE